MGYNLISGCHKCKVQMFHFRNEEYSSLLHFYIKHKVCARERLDNVVTIMDNNGMNEPEWSYSERDGGYKSDPLEKELYKKNFQQ